MDGFCKSCSYCIASNYSWSHINTWFCLVARGNSIIKINAGPQINARSFVRPQLNLNSTTKPFPFLLLLVI